MSENPLLELNRLPRFSAIRPEHVESAVDEQLAANRVELERILSYPELDTWEHVVQPIEDMSERLNRLWSPVSHLNAVMNSDELRAAYNRCLPKLSAYWTELAQDERLYRGYKAVASGPGFARLSAAQRKIVENTLRDFRLAGAELPEAQKQRFKAIQQELSTLTSRFEEHLLDATRAWSLLIVDDKDLAGLPETARAMARQEAEREGKAGWKFTLDAPSYIAFMTYADNADLRRQMYTAYATRASDQGPNAGRWDNSDLITQILRLRREAAHLLGYANYAERSLVTKMAKSVPEVLAFLHDLAVRSRPVAQQELDELRTFAREQHGKERLEAWDIGYYSEKLRQARYAFSQEDVRPYFPEPRVVQGLFDVVSRLYGLRIEQVHSIDVWHPDVRFYEIRDAQGGLRGQFYLDLYARPHKRGGAWMDEYISRKRTREGVQTPIAYLTCNFSPPVGDRPALFTHDEVTTLFHEFGHGLHHMLTQVDYVGVAGINGVAWDAVELPSQFMENWTWEREALDLIARHYQTGATLPDDLYQKMIAAKNFQTGMHMVRQLEFAMFDMRLYSEFDPDGAQSVQALLDEVRREVAVIIPPPFNRFQNSFSHIFGGGYAAGYYSYKWAEVLSADAFSKFEENGIFDRKTGEEFLHHVLEQGGVREPMDLFVAFRGRKPTIDALLRHSGLAA
jgi:oligopeptidase A